MPDARLPRILLGSRLACALDFAGVAAAAWISSAPVALGLLLATATVAALAWTGAYRRRVTERLVREAVNAALAAGLAVTLSELAFGRRPEFLVQLTVLAAVLLTASRLACFELRRVSRNRWPAPTLIIGGGRIAAAITESLRLHRNVGLRVAGVVDTGPFPAGRELPAVLGRLEDLPAIVRSHAIRSVIVAFGQETDAAVVDVLRACDLPGVDVYVVPRLYEIGTDDGYLSGDELWGFPLLRASRTARRRRTPWEKRLLDLVVAGTAMIFCAPLIALGALATKLSSPGPVFFKQDRVGQHGRVIRVLKLRTMPVSSDSDTRWSVGDSEVGWTGKLMRKTSIDELPQLWNVLRGDMSLVGPRPERLHFVTKFSQEIDGYADRHRVPVGLTGWAQVHGLRGDTSIEERARFDNYYIEHWSVWLDLVIIARTFLHVLRTACSWTRTSVPVTDLRQIEVPRYPIESDTTSILPEIHT